LIPVTRRTRLPHDVFVLLTHAGEEELLLVGKVTFTFDATGALELSDEQDPVTPADRHWGEAGASSVRYEGDLARRKAVVDLIVNASAHAPKSRATTQVVAELHTRHFTKRVLVSGDRAWRSGLAGGGHSQPSPFLAMPIVYEKAFGGTDLRGDNPRRHGCEPRNPVGVGFHSAGSPDEGTPLPNLEDPQKPLRHWTDRPPPVGFGAIYRAWRPRSDFVGTYDSQWLENTFPLPPADFDERYYQCAPQDQRMPGLEDGEAILLTHLAPEADLRIELPALAVPVYLRREASSERQVLRCDTVLVDTDERKLIMTGRICAPLGAGRQKIREAIVGALTPAEERAVLGRKRYVRLMSLPPSA
jgi:hypothetical protein